MLYQLQIRRNEELIKRAPLIVLDANPTIEAIEVVLELADKHQIPGKFFSFYSCL